MSKSDAQRRSYLADQMTMGERVEALERQTQRLKDTKATVDWAEYVDKRLTAISERLDCTQMTNEEGDEIQGEFVQDIARRFGELAERLDHFENDDSQYFHDELRSLGRRIADLESSGTTHRPVRYLDKAGNIVDKGDSRRAPSPTECGRIVVDAGEWDRLRRIKEAAMAVDSWDPVLCGVKDGGMLTDLHRLTLALREALKP